MNISLFNVVLLWHRPWRQHSELPLIRAQDLKWSGPMRVDHSGLAASLLSTCLVSAAEDNYLSWLSLHLAWSLSLPGLGWAPLGFNEINKLTLRIAIFSPHYTTNYGWISINCKKYIMLYLAPAQYTPPPPPPTPRLAQWTPPSCSWDLSCVSLLLSKISINHSENIWSTEQISRLELGLLALPQFPVFYH